MIKQECIGIPDMILLLMNFLFQKKKIKAEIVLSPGGAYFKIGIQCSFDNPYWLVAVCSLTPLASICSVASRKCLR